MMPKGVEHEQPKPLFSSVAGVKIPMMPKGVEHFRAAEVLAAGFLSEDSYDAERR